MKVFALGLFAKPLTEPLGAVIKLNVLGNVWLQKKQMAQVFVHQMLRPNPLAALTFES